MIITILSIWMVYMANVAEIPKTVADIDGNIYHTVKIGSQVWMAENLKTTHYRNGDDIPNITANSEWSKLTTGAFSWYENDFKNKNPYGAMYNFYAAADSRGLCPAGWHVPSYEDWITLQEYLGGADIAGGKMKETGTVHWTSPNVGATNESGFSGFPGGGRGAKGEFGELGNYATWWSSTADDGTYSWHWGLHPDKASTRYNPGHKASGFSVRCVKN